MADTVRYLMEEMVPELEDMQKKRYFSKHEIKEIVKRRQDYEYKLKRKAALREDFLSYAEYETKLEQLRQVRRRALGLAQSKQTLADYAIVKRVHFIFQRATSKFKRDLSLWTRWLEFCRATRSNRRLSRVAARALQLHPHVPGLWTYAAAWEFEENANPAAARALLQQGLRMCKDSRQMWLQYLDMEMMYVKKLRARRQALGLDVPGKDGHKQQQEQLEQQQQEEDGEDGEGPTEQDGGQQQEGEGVGGSGSILHSLQQKQEQQQQPDDDTDAAVAAVLTGAVAKVVMRSAAAALPRDLELRRGLLEVVSRYSFPGAASISQQIAEGIQADFPQDPAAIDILARHQCSPADAAASDDDIQRAADRFESAITACSSREGAQDGGCSGAAAERRERERRERLGLLWKLYSQFLQQRLNAVLEGPAEEQEAHVLAAAAAAQRLLRVLQRAHESGAAREEAYELWSDVALQLKQKKMALRAAKLACESFPASPSVWRRRVVLEARLRGSGAAAAQQLLSIIRDALRSVSADKAPEMWMQAIEMSDDEATLDQLSALMVQSLTGCSRGPPSGGMGHVVGCLLAKVWDVRGSKVARDLFAQLAALPPAGGDMFRRILLLEGQELEAIEQQEPPRKKGAAAASSSGTPARATAMQRIRRVLEAAVDAYGDCDASMWLAYAQFEQQHAKQGGGQIYWRAIKALRDSDGFVQEYRRTVCAGDAQ